MSHTYNHIKHIVVATDGLSFSQEKIWKINFFKKKTVERNNFNLEIDPADRNRIRWYEKREQKTVLFYFLVIQP